MMHRLECDHDATDCGCPCWCHRRCLARLPVEGGPCWRLRGHLGAHTSRWATERRRDERAGLTR